MRAFLAYIFTRDRLPKIVKHFISNSVQLRCNESKYENTTYVKCFQKFPGILEKKQNDHLQQNFFTVITVCTNTALPPFQPLMQIFPEIDVFSA